MAWHDAALAMAGAIGSATAIFHGILTQRLMVVPIGALLIAQPRFSAPIRRLVPLLLHLSTIFWLLGGLTLIAAAAWFGPGAKLAAGLFVGSLYLYAALANLWGTRGRHPGWLLMAVAVALIGAGIAPHLA